MSQPQSRALEPSESAFSFPLYRRRPLRSRTYNTLVQILSSCRTECSQPVQGDNDAEVRQGCDSGTSGVEFRQMTEENVTSNHDQMKSIDELNDRPNYKELEGHIVQETDIDKSKESAGFENGGFEVKQIKTPETDHVNLVMNKKEEVAGENCISIADFLIDDNQTDDCTLEIVKEQNDVSGIVNFEMDDFSSMGQLELDKEFSVHDFCEVLNSSFGDDMYVESSKAGENSKDDTSTSSGNILKESEHQLQLKEMELEKLISNPCVTDSFGCVTGDQETEEGEIFADELLHELSEDVVSVGDKSTGLAHAYEDNVDKEVLTCNDGDPNPLVINTSNNDGDSNTKELKATTTLVHDSDSQNVLCERDKETNKLSPVASFLEKLSSCGRNLGENDVENHIAAATIQDDDANKKKRKKGPLTKERKAKKKKKERIKRAEKNRELGIKRLKLPPPVLKPKTVKHCRHYLQGRCHEGEKCKFSHDVVPLTKSKPCCYFARQSCMKGDDCPFDHELSKYPCNNYATNGFCSRGSDCLFSHEIPANQSSPMTSSVSKPEKKGSAMILDNLEPYVKLTRPLNNLNSGGKTDIRGIFPKKVDDAKFLSSGISSAKKVEQVLEPVKTAKKTPKGVSFLLHEGIPTGDPSKQRRDESSPMPCGNTDIQKTIRNGPVSTNKSNETSSVEAPRKPRGINFLSFAQKSSLDDASCKTLSNLFSSGYDWKGKQSQLSSESGEIVEGSKQVSQNVTEISQEGVNSVPQLTVPQPVHSLTIGKTQLHDSLNAKICSSLKTSGLSNTPSLVQKAVQSTLAFAATFEPTIKLGPFRRQ